MDSILKTNNLSKTYGDKSVLKDVCMNINKGDIYGFVGENGAGKTTVIRVITGLVSATLGDYELFGVSSKSSNIYAEKRKMTAIVEAPSLYLSLTAKINLKIQSKMLGINDEEAIKRVMDWVGLGALYSSKKKVKDYSLGMRQRLGIAICLLGDPEFIVLDEPMNGLDPEGIKGLRELILFLNQKRGITFLISSHMLSELSKVATVYGFIHNGKIIKEITQQELIANCEKRTVLVMNNFDANNEEQVSYIFEGLKYKAKENKACIYGDFEINSIIIKLNELGISVENIRQIDEDVESYYLSVMKGETE